MIPGKRFEQATLTRPERALADEWRGQFRDDQATVPEPRTPRLLLLALALAAAGFAGTAALFLCLHW